MRTLAWLALAVVGFTIFDLLGSAVYAAAMDAAVVSIAAIGLLVALVHVRGRGLA
jgi:hypothetical protein